MGYAIHQYACSDRDEDDQDFIVVNSQGSNYHGGGVSNESFSSLGIEGKFADLLETVRGKTSTSQIKVDVRKLDTILSCHEPSIRWIDVLAVDVEGWELNVMDGFSIERYQPSVVILENLFEDPNYHDAMRRRGFELWRRVEPNDIYVNATRSKQGKSAGLSFHRRCPKMRRQHFRQIGVHSFLPHNLKPARRHMSRLGLCLE